MKKVFVYAIVALLLLTAAGIFYLSPYAVRIGLRMPRSYEECVQAGGVIGERVASAPMVVTPCTYNKKIFWPKILNNV